MILAAGRGERMRPLTDTVPKPLLEVGGQPLIAWHLQALATAGINEVVINHGWLGRQLEAGVHAILPADMQVRFSAEGEHALETGGGIFNVLDFFAGENFLVINGDVWCDYPLAQLPRHLQSRAHLVMVDNPAQHADGDFVLRDGLLAGKGQPRLTFSGIGVYSPELFTACQPGRFPLAPLLREAMNRHEVSGEYYAGRWYDVGTPARLEELDRQLRKSE